MAFQSFLLMMPNKTNILCVSKEKLRTFISDGSAGDDNEAAWRTILRLSPRMCIKKRRKGVQLQEQTMCLCISVSNFVYIFVAITLSHTTHMYTHPQTNIKPREQCFPYMARSKQTPSTNTPLPPTPPIFKNEKLLWLRQRSRRKRVTVCGFWLQIFHCSLDCVTAPKDLRAHSFLLWCVFRQFNVKVSILFFFRSFYISLAYSRTLYIIPLYIVSTFYMLVCWCRVGVFL